MGTLRPVPLRLLDLDAGNVLRLEAAPQADTAGGARWFDVTFTASAHPFAGTFASVLFESDLTVWRDALRTLDAPGTIVLGGDRGPELRLAVEQQRGSSTHLWAVEVELLVSGDDPWPRLTYLLFDVEPSFATTVAYAVDALLGR